MSTPRMSVVLVTPDTYHRLRKTISCLSRQTACQALEVVIVSPAKLPDVGPADGASFATVRFLEIGPFRDTGHPRAAAVSSCTAPIVAFAEDHCFPESRWAERLIQLHAGEWAAVSPALANGNPGAVSWADFLLNFGPSAWPLADGPVRYTPWHNTSYRRDVLCSFGDRLAHMLEAEIRLQEHMIQCGHKLFLAGATRVQHVNLSRWPSFLACQFFGGRLYGAARAEACGWSAARRLLYTAMLPLIPARRAPDLLRNTRRSMLDRRSAAFWMACFCGLLASACGEVTGYAFGPGPSGFRRITYEFERNLHIRPQDSAFLQFAEGASA